MSGLKTHKFTQSDDDFSGFSSSRRSTLSSDAPNTGSGSFSNNTGGFSNNTSGFSNMSATRSNTKSGSFSTGSRDANSLFTANNRGKSGTSSVAISLTEVRGTLTDLKPYANYQKDQLPTAIRAKLMEMITLSGKIIGTGNYATFLTIAGEVFGDIAHSDRGTVGHFFRAWALEARTVEGMDTMCALERAGVLPGPDAAPGEYCKSHVGVISDGRFVIHWSPPQDSDTIYIHTDGKATDLSIDNFHEELRQNGIKKYIMITQDKNGSVMHEPFPVPQKKRLMGDKGVAAPKKQSQQVKRDDCDTCEDNSWSAWAIVIFLIFIIIILIIVAVCIVNCSSKYDSGETVEMKEVTKTTLNY